MARAKKEAENLTVNIKSMPIKAHAGASKYINDDWGTVAFFIPRNSLGLQFADIELQYNCIYFLVGFRDLEWLAYVGQAKKRNSGGSVLKRLREHADSTTEKYRDNWDWVIVVTNKNDAWCLDDLNALENAFYHEIPPKKNLNGNTPNSAGADFNSYLDKIKQIKAYIAILGFDIFEQTEDIEKVQVTSVTNEYTIVEDLQNGMARIPEIVTPQRIVKDMVDMLEKENPDIWSPDKTFLDPACKGGEYLYEIYTRLMESETMKAQFPNDIARAFHILQNQVYGIALSQVSLDRTVNKLNGFGQNIKIIPNYISILKSKDLGTKADGKAITFKDKISEVFGKDMKFDVVIGNPPYNENGGLLGDRSSSIYQYFIDFGEKVSKNMVAMIIPSRWMLTCPRGISTKWVEHMRSRDDIVQMTDYIDSSDCFKGVQISGGVCHFVIKKGYQGECTRTLIIDGTKHKIKDKLSYDGVIIRDPLAFRIIDKIKLVDGNNYSKFYDLVTPARFYANGDDLFNTNWTDFSFIETPEYCIKYFCNARATGVDYGYISYEQMTKNEETVNYPKILISSTGDDKQIIGKIFYAGTNCICSRTYIPILSKDFTEKQILNTLAYMKSKFFRYTVSILKITQRIARDQFLISPLQDFTSNSDIDWSKSIAEIDQQLYKKYGLSQEEIDYIEKTIKPME